MKWTFIALIILLTSCFNMSEQMIVQGPSPKMQKQKIAVLQKKLESAEKAQKKIENSVEKLSFEIDEAQLALIRRQLDDHEINELKNTTLFAEERESLYKMIESGPSPSACEAQVVLDRILRMITELSDEEKHVF